MGHRYSIEWTDAAGESHADSRATRAKVIEAFDAVVEAGAEFALATYIGDDKDGRDDEIVASWPVL